MTVSPSWRQEHSAAAAENGSLRVSRKGDPSWLPISDEDDGSRCSRADFRKESGSAGGQGSVWAPLIPPCPPSRRSYSSSPISLAPLKSYYSALLTFQWLPYVLERMEVAVPFEGVRDPRLGSRAAGLLPLCQISEGQFSGDPGPRAENTSWRGGGWALPGNQILPDLGLTFYAQGSSYLT